MVVVRQIHLAAAYFVWLALACRTTAPTAMNGDAAAGDDRPVVVDAQGPREAWAVPDAPPSTCSPASDCDGGTCWQRPSGAYVCASFAPNEEIPPRETCDGGPPGRFLPGRFLPL
jgi:hypothetical protein